MKGKITWICVADAAHARVLESTGLGKPLSTIHESTYDLAGAKQYSDEPGRSFESVDDSRHRMAPSTDPAREEKREMAAGLAEWLEDARKQRRFDRLVLVAAPQFLGDLRAKLSSKLRDSIIAEIGKDYAKLSESEIRERVGKHAPV